MSADRHAARGLEARGPADERGGAYRSGQRDDRDPRIAVRREYERRRTEAQGVAAANRSIARVYDLVRTYLPRLEPGDILSEADLVRSMSSSRNAVRAALQLLTNDGLLTRKTKVGTRAGHSLSVPLDALLPDIDKPAVGMSAEIRTRIGYAPTFIQEMFNLPPGAAVAATNGLLSSNGQRIGVNAGYIPLTRAEAMRADELVANTSGVIDFLEDSLGVTVAGSRARIGALGCDPETASRIGAAVGAPMLWLEMVFVDHRGRDRALLHVRYRADYVEFSGDMPRYQSPVAAVG